MALWGVASVKLTEMPCENRLMRSAPLQTARCSDGSWVEVSDAQQKSIGETKFTKPHRTFTVEDERPFPGGFCDTVSEKGFP